METNRKSIRLKNYDYSQNGCYFITICVKDKRKILFEIYTTNGDRIGTSLRARPNIAIELTPIGIEAEKSIQYINEKYNGRITVDNYCIMPDHIHLLITINNETPAVIKSTRTYGVAENVPKLTFGSK